MSSSRTGTTEASPGQKAGQAASERNSSQPASSSAGRPLGLTITSKPGLKGSLGLADVDVAIICALPVETDSMIAVLDQKYNDPVNVDNYLHLTGGIIKNSKVAILRLTNPGQARGAHSTETLAKVFPNAQLFILAGICGGVGFRRGEDYSKQHVYLGDVIISTSVQRFLHSATDMDHGLGLNKPAPGQERLLSADSWLWNKLNYCMQGDNISNFCEKVHENLKSVVKARADGKFDRWNSKPTADRPNLNDRLYNSDYIHLHYEECPDACCEIGTKKACERAKRDSCETTKCDVSKLQRVSPESSRDPEVYWGPYGSEDIVIRSSAERDRLFNEGILAVDTEGHGVWQVASDRRRNIIIIKGVSDYADSHKNKAWQSYASMTAACTAKAFIQSFHNGSVNETLETAALIFNEDKVEEVKIVLRRSPGLISYPDRKAISTNTQGWVQVPSIMKRPLDIWTQGCDIRDLIVWGRVYKDWVSKAMQQYGQKLEMKGQTAIFVDLSGPAQRSLSLLSVLCQQLARCVTPEPPGLPAVGDDDAKCQQFLMHFEDCLDEGVVITVMMTNVPHYLFSKNGAGFAMLRLLLESARFRNWWHTSAKPILQELDSKVTMHMIHDLTVRTGARED